MFFCPLIRDECPGKKCVLYGDADESEVCDLPQTLWAIKRLAEDVENIAEELAAFREDIAKS